VNFPLSQGFETKGEDWAWRRPEPWGGRVDDPEDPEAQRWHQRVRAWDGQAPLPGVAGSRRIWFIGCPTDIGVARNKGRTGAAAGPGCIRRAMANLPVRFGEALELVDAGDLEPRGEDLEGLMEGLESLVGSVVASGGFPIVLGGGHEVAYGHHRGLRRGLAALSRPSPRVLSFDAHFDLRPEGPPEKPLHSGNMFKLLARESAAVGEALDYSVAGIQLSSNTQSLFRRAQEIGAHYLLARDATDAEALLAFLRGRASGELPCHVTLCADVLSAAHAPAVSAPQPFGIEPPIVLEGLRFLAKTGSAVGLDVAEVSPRYEGDDGTARLVAILLFAWINAMAGVE